MKIVIQEPSKGKRELDFGPGSYSIGRSNDNDMVLGDSQVSRRHARILYYPDQGQILVENGTLIINTGAFVEANLKKAGYQTNPLEDGSLDKYKVHAVDTSQLTTSALEGIELSTKEKGRSKNFFALGLVFWMYGRETEGEVRRIYQQFAKKPGFGEANVKVFKAGYPGPAGIDARCGCTYRRWLQCRRRSIPAEARARATRVTLGRTAAARTATWFPPCCRAAAIAGACPRS